MRLPPFQTLLDAHGRAVYRFLIAIVGPVDADDCYQETWLAAVRAYPELDAASNLRGWLFTIARHKAIDHIRSRARRATLVADPAELAGTGASALPAQSAAIADSDLWTAVAVLPDKQRTALALRFIADAPYADIATAMQTSEPAARRNVHEALKRLRQEHVR
ncbi:MAG: sigma-70 family RNA polymerase sigma factor [Solirubrobacteraceae bacterium]